MAVYHARGSARLTAITYRWQRRHLSFLALNKTIPLVWGWAGRDGSVACRLNIQQDMGRPRRRQKDATWREKKGPHSDQLTPPSSNLLFLICRLIKPQRIPNNAKANPARDWWCCFNGFTCRANEAWIRIMGEVTGYLIYTESRRMHFNGLMKPLSIQIYSDAETKSSRIF